MNGHFNAWRQKSARTLKGLQAGCHPREVIAALAEDLLAHYTGQPLIDPYAVYQHLMDYWAATLQDDGYLIAADGWKAETTRVIETDKKGKEKDKGWTCDLIPKPLIVARYFAREQTAIAQLAAELEGVSARLAEMEEEHGGEDEAFAELDKVNKANVAVRLKEIEAEQQAVRKAAAAKPPSFPRKRESTGATVAEAPASYNDDASAEAAIFRQWQILNDRDTDLKKRLKQAEAALDAKAYARYPKLTEAEIKTLAVDDKWLAALDAAIHGEMDRISQALTQRVKELAERYEMPLPWMVSRVAELEAKVNRHLERMGFLP